MRKSYNSIPKAYLRLYLIGPGMEKMHSFHISKHFKYIFDIDTDKYTLVVDDVTIRNNLAFSNELKCITSLQFCGDKVEGTSYELALDNVNLYEEDVTPVITEVVDENGSSEVAYESEYVEVTLSHEMGNVLPKDISFINTNGIQKVSKVTVSEEDKNLKHFHNFLYSSN